MTAPTVSEFDCGIAATPRDDGSAYDVELGAGWQIGSGINGGMLLATVGNALRQVLSATAGHPDPISVSGLPHSAQTNGWPSGTSVCSPRYARRHPE